MDNLRIVLLLIGVVFVAGIYLWETRWRRRPRGGALDDFDLPSPPVERAPKRAAKSHRKRSRAGGPSLWRARQSSLPFEELDAGTAGAEESAGEDSLAIIGAEPALGELDYIVPRPADEKRVRDQLSRLEQFSTAAPKSNGSDTSDASLVIALTLMARAGKRFSGADVRSALESIGFHYGRMQVFHCYDGPESGRRDPLCSIANVINPGTFDIERMDELSTPGLAMFMQVYGHEAAGRKLDRMLEIGERLAERLGGELRDESRSTLTNQAINHLRERIAEFSRLQRLRR